MSQQVQLYNELTKADTVQPKLVHKPVKKKTEKIKEKNIKYKKEIKNKKIKK